MPYIQTTDPADAVGPVKQVYDGYESRMGYVPNYALVFSAHPDVLLAWDNLIGLDQQPHGPAAL